MREERLNQFCAVDPSAFSSVAELKALLTTMGSFSGWWLEDWPTSFEESCKARFDLDEVSVKALRRLLRPTESGFRLIKRPSKTMGIDSWTELQSLKPQTIKPFDVVIGRSVSAARSLLVEKDEHLELLSQSPRQLYLPSGVESLMESVSVLTLKGGPTWIVDPHLSPWATNPEQDAKFGILEALTDKMQRNASADELVLVTTWKPEHKKENSKWGVPDPNDQQIKKQLGEKLKTLLKRPGYSIRLYLDQGAEYSQFDTHKRFLFNQHGGIEFEYGLTDRSKRKAKPKSYFGFIGQSLHRQLRETYSKCNPRNPVQRFKLLANVY